jgi:hypothetical protein
MKNALLFNDRNVFLGNSSREKKANESDSSSSLHFSFGIRVIGSMERLGRREKERQLKG